MNGHTPGPWTYFVGNANGRGLIRIETAHDAKPVAGVHIASMARGGVSKANARLIAAAPLLLQELRGASTQMERAAECIEAGRYDEALLYVRSMSRSRRAAIAEATGEQL
ncbi:MAG TPA: hypothetical protein VN612_16895 [Acidobacteriaceae bacterium]|nr:hypothetical protein [Acidobacteriaceae bacterium]